MSVSAYAQQPSDVLLQGFYWNTHPGDVATEEGVWWDSLATLADQFAADGFQTVWVPPPQKGGGGRYSMGYDLYDYYDLGNLGNQGTQRTRFGTFAELQQMMTALKGAGLRVMADAILNHRFGGDAQSDVECVPGGGPPFQNYNIFNPQSGRVPADASFFHANNTHCDYNDPYHSAIFGEDICHFNGTDNVLDALAPNNGWYSAQHNLGFAGDSLVVWGRWLVQEIGFDEIRLDAVKHMEPGFIAPWIVELSAGEQPFIVGEHFSGTSEIMSYHNEVEQFNTTFGAGGANADLSMFDFGLRDALKQMANGGGSYDMRGLNGAGLVFSGLDPFNVVTWVENHDKDRIGFVGGDCSDPNAFQYGSSCYVLGIDSGHDPIVTRKGMTYAYILAAEGRPTVFWKDYYWYGLDEEIRNLMALRRQFATQGSTPMSGLNPFFNNGNDQDFFVLRRDGNGTAEEGLLLALNDSPSATQDAYVDSPFTNLELKDYTDGIMFDPTQAFADGRVQVKAFPGSYAWWAPTGLYPMPPGGVPSSFTQEATPGGKLHFVVLRAEDAASLRINGQPIQPGDEVAVLGPSGTDVAGIGRIGQSVRWDGVHDMVIEVLGNSGDVQGPGRLEVGDALQLVVKSQRDGQTYPVTATTFAPGGTTFDFSADRPGSLGGAAPFSLTTTAGGTYAVNAVSLVTAFDTETGATAAPLIDGVNTDGAYSPLGLYTTPDDGRSFGDYGLVALDAYANDVALYVTLTGVAETNGRELYLFFDANAPIGAPGGSPLPAGSDPASPFSDFQPTMDVEMDFGLRLTANPDGADVSLIDYRGGGATDRFVGTLPLDGTPLYIATGPLAGSTFAYDAAASLTDHTGIEGLELCLPLSAIGAVPGDLFRFLALYGNNSFISAESIPQIDGQGTTFLGTNPDFTAIPGTQATASNALPVELATFTAVADGDAAVLRWTTASETNNAGFEVQHQAPGQTGFALVRFVEGAGTSVEAQAYQTRVAELEPGAHTFRLKQVDHDGTFAYSQEVELTVEVPERIVLEPAYPNPFNPETRFRFAVQEAVPVEVALYDALGRQVQHLYRGTPEAERMHTVRVDGADLPSGLYFIRLSSEVAALSQAVLLVK